MQLVVFDERHPTLEPWIPREGVHVLQDFLPGRVGRMRLSRKDDLHRPPQIQHDFLDALQVLEDQRCALVPCEAPRKPDRQGIRIQQRPHRNDLTRIRAVHRPPRAGALAHERQQRAPAAAEVDQSPVRPDPDLLGDVLVLAPLRLLERQREVAVELGAAEVRLLAEAEPEEPVDQRVGEVEVTAVGHDPEPSVPRPRTWRWMSRAGRPARTLR